MSWGMVTQRLSLYASSAEQLPSSLSEEGRGGQRGRAWQQGDVEGGRQVNTECWPAVLRVQVGP